MTTTRFCRLILSGLMLPLLLLLAFGSRLAAQPSPLQTSTPGSVLPAADRPALITSKPINQVLPADSAFSLQYYPLADSAVLLHWDIKPGYYLYRKSIKLRDSGGSEIGMTLPPGREITDEYFGKVQAYYDTLDVEVALNAGIGDSKVTLMLEYQGCAEALYCYPPQQKELGLVFPRKP